MPASDFWLGLDQLITDNKLCVDRPKGSPHPNYPSLVYPLDYGYLENTRSADGDGLDVWIGSLNTKVTGIICTLDLQKRDAEIKLLLGCTSHEARQALAIHNVGSQVGLLLERTWQTEPRRR